MIEGYTSTAVVPFAPAHGVAFTSSSNNRRLGQTDTAYRRHAQPFIVCLSAALTCLARRSAIHRAFLVLAGCTLCTKSIRCTPFCSSQFPLALESYCPFYHLHFKEACHSWQALSAAESTIGCLSCEDVSKKRCTAVCCGCVPPFSRLHRTCTLTSPSHVQKQQSPPS